MLASISNFAILVVVAMSLASATEPGSGPSIGIFTSPLVDNDCGAPPASVKGAQSCLIANYVEWLQGAGIRAVPIQWNTPLDDKLKIMDIVDGILFPGGWMDSKTSYPYFIHEACETINASKAINDNGRHFVVWGTCQGMQMMSICAAGNNSALSNGFVGVLPRMLPLVLTPAAKTSSFLGSATPEIVGYMTQFNTTLNYHHEGVEPSAYQQFPSLDATFTITSTNIDDNGKEFVSTMEGKHYPFYGTQWHPEWTLFDFSDSTFSKSIETVEVSQFASRFLHRLLREASIPEEKGQIADADTLESLVVDHSPRYYYGYGVNRYWIGAHWDGAHNDNSDESKTVILISAIAAVVVAVAIAGPVGFIIGRRRMKETEPLLPKSLINNEN